MVLVRVPSRLASTCLSSALLPSCLGDAVLPCPLCACAQTYVGRGDVHHTGAAWGPTERSDFVLLLFLLLCSCFWLLLALMSAVDQPCSEQKFLCALCCVVKRNTNLFYWGSQFSAKARADKTLASPKPTGGGVLLVWPFHTSSHFCSCICSVCLEEGFL